MKKLFSKIKAYLLHPNSAVLIVVGFVASTVSILGYLEGFLAGPSIEGYWVGDPRTNPVTKEQLKKSCIRIIQQAELRGRDRVGVFADVYYYSGFDIGGKPTRVEHLAGSFDGAEFSFRYVARSGADEEFSSFGEGILTLTAAGNLEGVWSGQDRWSSGLTSDNSFIATRDPEDEDVWYFESQDPDVENFGTWHLSRRKNSCPT